MDPTVFVGARGHIIYMFHYECQRADAPSVSSRLYFVDLAAAERTDGGPVNPRATKEDQDVSLSMVALRDFLNAVSRGAPPQVTSRDHRLTLLLPNASRTHFQLLAAISPASLHAQSTVAALRVAQMLCPGRDTSTGATPDQETTTTDAA